MLSLIRNITKVLFRKKTIILTLIIIPTILTVGASFLLGSEMKYGVGLVNEDKGIVSKEIIENIKSMDSVKIMSLDKDEVDTAVVSKEVELCILIDKNFSENIIKGKIDTVNIKSIGDSEIKASVVNVIDSTTDNMLKIGKLANKDEEKFNKYLNEYKNSDVKYEVNKEIPRKISVSASIGMVIMMMFISSFFITRFIIDDEKGGTKDRILLANISKLKYYTSVFIVFFMCSAVTSILYYLICKLANFDFQTQNTIYYLYVLLAVNFVAIGFNLVIVTVSSTPSVASNLSSLIVTCCSMISGLFWPFYVMPKPLQKIGDLLPTRWAMVAIENIQKGYGLGKIMPQIISIILCGLLFLVITIIFSRKSKSAS